MKLILGLALTAAVSAGSANAATTVIHAGHLMAEPGKGVKVNQSVVIENGKVVAIKDGFVAGDTVIDLKDSWVMPGLIDMHTHVSVQVPLDSPDPRPLFLHAYIGRSAEIVLASLPTVKAVLMNGFTTVRNLGDPSSTTYDLRDAINKGVVVGPRMMATEPQFSVAGGDYDASRWGVRRELEQYVTNRGSCSGVQECIKDVREEINRGADVIKLREGGAPFMDPKVEAVEFQDELNAIVSTAHKLNRTVGAHVNATPTGNRMAIEAGVDTIEHGPIDDAAIKLMKERGTAYTPTLVAYDLAKAFMKDIPGGRDFYKEASESTRKAYKAGVMITYGTDLGAVPVDRENDEFGYLVAAGLPPEQAIRAATVNAAIKLGRGDSLGSLAPGKIADVVAVKRDPLADISAMKAVSFVMKDGKVFKDEK
jgi:imidazolonepropionase-like amidohydrolase